MTEQQLQALDPAWTRSRDPFLFCCGSTQTCAHLGTYVRGRLSDLPRQSVEPLALRGGTPVRTRQEFLQDHLWDCGRLRDGLQARIAAWLPRQRGDDLGTVGLSDETSAVKQGSKTPGVQRQYRGGVGQVDNGIVSVPRGVSKGRFKSLIDAELYLPQSWSDDRPRGRQAGIPADVTYRAKWRIALEEIDRAAANGVPLDWLTCDEAYGQRPGFIAGLDERQWRFVGEVPRHFSCLVAHRWGRRPAAQAKGRPAAEVVRASRAFLGQPWQVLRLARPTEQDQVWRVKVARVWLSSGAGWSAQTDGLIWASNDATGEEKFFLSNAAADAPVATLLRVAFRRANVEHSFRVCKSELGFTPFEGRNYLALRRHQTLGLAALGFVAEHTEGLRGENPRADEGASRPGVSGGVPALAAAAAAEE